MSYRMTRFSSLALALAVVATACSSKSTQNAGDAGPDASQGGTGASDADRLDPGATDGGGSDVSKHDATSPDASKPKLEGVIIDDFEDGDGKPTSPPGGWYCYDDQVNGGASSITYTGSTDASAVMEGPGYQSSRSLEVTFAFDQGDLTYQPYVGWGVGFATASAPLDVSAYVGIAYVYKGSAHRVRVETFEVQDYDLLGMEVAAASDWKTVVIPFSQLSQEGWGTPVDFNPKNVGNISFQARGSTGQKGKVDIDNLMFLTRLPDQAPDMDVLPAQPPAEDPIPSISITHPAQAKARTYLSRGYNITNWLEEGRFAGFTYDAAYVQKLAAAGFKSLRLPIDLDRYIVSSTVTGDVADVVVHDDLFTVLDAFATWTASAGMSLTIDYHQYDKSIDKAKPETIANAVALWGKVASHFANDPREDLFYELLNEPEQSMDGTAPTQDEMTAIAERMIAAIRATDTSHTILFGDVDWYGIDALASRKKLLSDSNVIYVFHNYEPYVFTHQGASWANMPSTHDLPYPYTPDRWSKYFGDLGFNKNMDAWLLSAAEDYYETGNRAYIHNLAVKAKRWAVTNNVPVICNEFGAYDRTSRLEDRARYLTDVVSVYEELDIPWQQWFMIMDDNGVVLPEYRAALKLGQ